MTGTPVLTLGSLMAACNRYFKEADYVETTGRPIPRELHTLEAFIATRVMTAEHAVALIAEMVMTGFELPAPDADLNYDNRAEGAATWHVPLLQLLSHAIIRYLENDAELAAESERRAGLME